MPTFLFIIAPSEPVKTFSPNSPHEMLVINTSVYLLTYSVLYTWELMVKHKPTLACDLVHFYFSTILGTLYRNRLRENLTSSQTHFVMSSTSSEYPARKAKSNGVAPSSLGKAKAWTPPGRHKRKRDSLGRPHLIARCRRDSLHKDTEKENTGY